MNGLSESHLIKLVIEWVKENNPKRRTEVIEINQNTDLFKSGVIDSFGLVDLIVYIESEIGCVVELADTDPEEFSVVRGLCRIALKGDHSG